MVKSNLNGPQKKQLWKILADYDEEIKKKPPFIKDFKFKNDLLKPVVPRIVKPYPISISMLNKAKAKIQELVDQGMLTKVDSAVHTHPASFLKRQLESCDC